MLIPLPIDENMAKFIEECGVRVINGNHVHYLDVLAAKEIANAYCRKNNLPEIDLDWEPADTYDRAMGGKGVTRSYTVRKDRF
jgi:hypothetical protein